MFNEMEKVLMNNSTLALIGPIILIPTTAIDSITWQIKPLSIR
ncbi:DUF2619 domain-containing protein [Oceanobacillus saliphilus]|nr:DUF2619 domain-containing protein [Oceanobacillus saliphilus]